MIDPQAQKLKVASAKIFFDIKVGRAIAYYDERGREIGDWHGYSGPVDIKNTENEISLIKPHSIFNSIQYVKEDGFFIGAVLDN